MTPQELADFLVAEGEMKPEEAPRFTYYVTSKVNEKDWGEWRLLSGTLGFGGKVYIDCYGEFRIGCYPEDANRTRKAKINRLNRAFRGER